MQAYNLRRPVFLAMQRTLNFRFFRGSIPKNVSNAHQEFARDIHDISGGFESPSELFH